MRQRLVVCEELCTSLIALYRAARTLSVSGLGLESETHVRQAPASVHTICSIVRDFVDSVNQVITEVEFNEAAETPGSDSPVVPAVRQAILKAMDEHTALRSWKDTFWLGLSVDAQHHIDFKWSTAIECLQKNPKRGYLSLKPTVLLARRVGDESLKLFDPLTGPIAEERAIIYSANKKLHAQIEQIRTLVNQKCDVFETEMRSVQSAIIKAQSQTMALMKNLTNIGLKTG